MHESRVVTTCSTIDEDFRPVNYFTTEQPCKKRHESGDYAKGKHP